MDANIVVLGTDNVGKSGKAMIIIIIIIAVVFIFNSKSVVTCKHV